jgi:RNA polymerase sigma-70 factor (ECF subfamily)
MSTTPVSLLQRLRRQPAREDWERLVSMYTPLLYYWARRAGLQQTDAADLVQDVLSILVKKLPDFEYDPARSFRSWLRTILLNEWRKRRRRPNIATASPSDPRLAEVALTDETELLSEEEYRARLTARALELMRSLFHETTWRACWELVVNERPGAEVAAELGLSLDAVYAARSRVLRRLRQELAGLLD